MALSLVGSVTTYSSPGVVTSFSINVPAGVADGDLLLWEINGQTATQPASPPAGWTVWVASTTTALYCNTYQRIASSEPASYTSPTLTSARHASTMICIRGADTTTPADVAAPAAVAGTTANTFPAITPVTAGAWVVAFGGETFASGITGGTVTSSNLTMDGQGLSTAAAVTNVLAAVGHLAWTSGAVTPVMTQGSAMTRTLGVSSAVRPAAAVAARRAMFGISTAAVNRAANY